jgi:mono/diheme cytochrome c family protein
MFRLLRRLLVASLAVVGLAALALGVWLAVGGISARRPPGRLEAVVAPRLRSLAIPSEVRRMRNPIAESPEAITAGLEHFADHCAVCHANDGSGDTEMGRGLYPRVPDMRGQATQALSDGELFYVIENGVRLTGMAAWGDGSAESERESWRLVHFIRHLPTLSEAEVARMKALNPRTPSESREEEEARKFLEGSGDAPAPAPVHKHGGRK